MRLCSIRRGERVTAQQILSAGNKLKVRGIAACAVPTKVVELEHTNMRKRAHEKVIGEPMGTGIFPVELNYSVAFRAQISLPRPTRLRPCGLVNLRPETPSRPSIVLQGVISKHTSYKI